MDRAAVRPVSQDRGQWAQATLIVLDKPAWGRSRQTYLGP